MDDRVKKSASVSVPSELDAAIRAAAERSGMAYSEWRTHKQVLLSRMLNGS